MKEQIVKAIEDNVEIFNKYADLGPAVIDRESINQAASAISAMVEKEMEAFAVGFADFRQTKCARFGKEWLHKGNIYTTAQLLTIYKEQNHGK